MPISTSSKRATPELSVTAYSSTARPEREVPDKRNVTPSFKPSSEVFGNGEVAPFQHVIEIHRCDLSAYYRNTANLLRLVFVVALFGDGINAGG